jgi:hypothetical protein
MSGKTLVGYARRTSQQGRSGLGLEAQKKALERFAASEGFTLSRVFVEVETGKGATHSTVARNLPLRLARHADSVAQWPWQSWTGQP